MTTTISTIDIRDLAVTSPKLETNITVAGYLDVDDIRTSQSYVSINTLAGTGGTIATKNLVVSDNYAGGLGYITGNTTVYFEKDVRINGNLVIGGGSTTIESETVNIADNHIRLNSNLTNLQLPESAGIEINRGSKNAIQFNWDEGAGYWTLGIPNVSDVIANTRVIEQAYGDLRYVRTAGHTMNGPLIISQATNGILLGVYSSNSDGIFRMGADATTYGYNWKYTGQEAGINNSLELWSDGTDAGGVALKVLRVQQDGIVRFQRETSFTGNITMVGTATVDGVDISVHNANGITNVKHVTDAYLAALAGTSGTPSGTNKYVTDADTRMTNSRTPTTHGDSLHNALSYFDIVTDGTTVGTASAANQKIKVTGSNGIVVAVKNDTVGYDADIQIGADLLMKYTTGTPVAQTVNGDVTFPGNILIQGGLTIEGTTTYVNTTQLSIGDNIITLNADLPPTSSPTEDAGIEINRGNLATRLFKWNETNDMWETDTHLRVNGGDLKLNDSVGAASYTLNGYATGNELWAISAGSTASTVKIATGLDNDRQIEVSYAPGTIGAQAGVLKIGQTLKNNANFTHGVTSLLTNGVERIRIDNAGNVGIGASPTTRLDVAGNIRTTGTIVINAATPELHFNRTADTPVNMALRAVADGLDFYEPADGNKIHLQILRSTGLNSPFGYRSGGTQVIDASRNVTAVNVTATGTTTVAALNSAAITSTGQVSATNDLKTTTGAVNIQDKVKLEWDEATQSLNFNFL